MRPSPSQSASRSSKQCQNERDRKHLTRQGTLNCLRGHRPSIVNSGAKCDLLTANVLPPDLLQARVCLLAELKEVKNKAADLDTIKNPQLSERLQHLAEVQRTVVVSIHSPGQQCGIDMQSPQVLLVVQNLFVCDT